MAKLRSIQSANTPFVDQLIWEAPPESTSKNGAYWGVFVEALKSRPGEWAISPREYKNSNSAINAAVLLKRRYVGVEAKGRGTKVYARWTGEVPR